MPSGSHTAPAELALIDISALLAARRERSAAIGTGHAGDGVADVARRIDQACRSLGFFRVVGHGVDLDLFEQVERHALAFFEQPEPVKARYAMARAGTAWRGWFPNRGELTSGVPDRKEGLYIGLEHPPDHPRVVDATPLHGANLFPPGELGPAVLAWLDALRPVADALMSAIGVALGIGPDWFIERLTGDPTVLFRIFHYPAMADNASSGEWGVGEHTDYGLLTLLAQDARGGLEVRTPDGRWLTVPAEPGVLVCNIGDMLDRLTEGRYRSTPHRVRNTSGVGRISFPYFFDPSWDAEVPVVPLAGSPPPDDATTRWDGRSVHAWTGRYGDYLVGKVARVFPDLFAAQIASESASTDGSVSEGEG